MINFRRYINSGRIEWDEAKNTLNKVKHGLDFAEFDGFDGPTATSEDTRFDYGEARFQTIGRIGSVPYLIVFTFKNARLRLISWRRAHQTELRRYEQTTSPARIRD